MTIDRREYDQKVADILQQAEVALEDIPESLKRKLDDRQLELPLEIDE